MGRHSVKAALLRATRIQEKMAQGKRVEAGPSDICMIHEPYMARSKRVNQGGDTGDGEVGASLGEVGSVRSGMVHVGVSGMRQLSMLMAGLDAIKKHIYRLSPDQNKIVMLGIKALITRIFPERELLQNLSFIMEYFDLEELYEDIIVQMRRRGGKTTALACLASLTVLCVESGNTYVAASAVRVALITRDMSHDILKSLISNDENFHTADVRKHDKQLTVKTPYGTDSILLTLPGNQEIGATVHTFSFFLFPKKYISDDSSIFFTNNFICVQIAPLFLNNYSIMLLKHTYCFLYFSI